MDQIAHNAKPVIIFNLPIKSVAKMNITGMIKQINVLVYHY